MGVLEHADRRLRPEVENPPMVGSVRGPRAGGRRGHGHRRGAAQGALAYVEEYTKLDKTKSTKVARLARAPKKGKPAPKPEPDEDVEEDDSADLDFD